MQRVSTGIDGFDSLIAGGLPAGSIVVLRGSPGTGKSTFGLQFLHAGAVQDRELGLFVTFEEMPDQLYAEAANFGWDLPALERQNLLRLVATSPEVLMDGLQEPGGLLQRLAGSARRLVVDSVTLLEYTASPEDVRERLLRLRSALKRMGLTAILIEENPRPEGHGALSFLADGVINLHFEAKPDGYRSREVEVLKLRGTPFVSGRHLFRIGDNGIAVHPALTTQEILPMAGEFEPTGIAELDGLLGGGIPTGATVLLDANSRADYRVLAGLITAAHLKRGQGLAVSASGSTFPAAQQEELTARLGLNLPELIQHERLLVLDNQGVDLPEWAHPLTVSLSNLSDTEHHNRMRNLIKLELASRSGRQWVLFQDLNALAAARGAGYLRVHFAEQSAMCLAHGVTTLCLINSTELDHQLVAHLQRIATAVLRSWVDGRYQHLEVLKSPTGRVSEPFLVQYSNEYPFVTLK